MEDHNSQDPPGWVLLAYLISRCLQRNQSLHQMLEVLRKAAAQIPTIKACGSFSTFSAVGIGLHQRNSSSLKWPAQMDSDSDRLFHQMDRSCPYKNHFSQSDYQLLRRYCSQIWLP
jgi:hypothetical protein